MKRSYKTWKGFKAITKPNNHKCRFCNKINSDWKELDEYFGKNLNSFVHKLCVYKVRHYGMTPEQFSKWHRGYESVRRRVLQRDNYTCIKCNNNCSNCKRDLAEKGKIKLNVHHVKPVKKGGTTEMNNLVTVCQFCNQMLDSKRYSILK